MRRLGAALVGVAVLACGQRPAGDQAAGTPERATPAPAAVPAPATTPAASAPTPLPASGPPPATAGSVPSPPKAVPGAGPEAGAWTAAPVRRPPSGGTAVLTAVTVTPQTGFDRVVFDFAGTLPGYRVELAPRPVVACGSGDPVELPGTAVLVVAFRGAAAHDERGQVTVADRDRRPGLPGVAALKLFCDFEGDVSWALALPRATRFRVSTDAAPARVTVEIEHPR